MADMPEVSDRVQGSKPEPVSKRVKEILWHARDKVTVAGYEYLAEKKFRAWGQWYLFEPALEPNYLGTVIRLTDISSTVKGPSFPAYKQFGEWERSNSEWFDKLHSDILSVPRHLLTPEERHRILSGDLHRKGAENAEEE